MDSGCVLCRYGKMEIGDVIEINIYVHRKQKCENDEAASSFTSKNLHQVENVIMYLLAKLLPFLCYCPHSYYRSAFLCVLSFHKKDLS